MTQYLVEEACRVALDAFEAARTLEQGRDDAIAAAQEQVHRQLVETRKQRQR